MTTFDDYEVLSILGTNLNSTCYKVRHKNSDRLYVWKAINYEQHNLTEGDIVERINARKNSTRQNVLLPIHDYIRHGETATVYLITEYCKHGSLLDLTRKCRKNGDYFHEDFVWNVLYKLACFCKIKYDEAEGFNTHEIFIDEKYDVKLFNFTLTNATQSNLTCLNGVLQQMIYLNGEKFPEYYSNELRNLVEFLLQPPDGVIPTIDAILCHPTALTRINTQIETIFLNDPQNTHEPSGKENLEAQLKLENLRNREANLKKQEERIRQQVSELEKREKKVALSERSVREKMMKAELYLKRARDSRSSTISGNTKTSTNRNSMVGFKEDCPTKKELIDNIDFSYSPDCGDSSILPRTSCKLNMRELPKPPKFTRTLSERRVRFKPHSPLKDINTFKRETLKMQHDFKKLDSITSDSDKTSETNSDKVTMEKKPTTKKFLLGSMFSKKPSGKKLSSVGSSSDSVSAHTYEDIDKGFDNHDDCKPINWTKESKRHAFDLLRIMNGEENVNGVKHTFL